MKTNGMAKAWRGEAMFFERVERHNKNTRKVDKTVGGNISALRESLGISVEELGACVGYISIDIERIEAGALRPSALILYKLACVLQCPMASFFVDNRINQELSS